MLDHFTSKLTINSFITLGWTQLTLKSNLTMVNIHKHFKTNLKIRTIHSGILDWKLHKLLHKF